MAALFSFLASQEHRQVKERAQAITEFAIVLPILIVLLVGILESGRMIFIYAAVNNGSREAARYASAAGLSDSSPAVEKYRDCIGIRDMAKRSAFFVPLTITISYDHGSTTATFDTCDGNTDTGIVVNSGTNRDRATITVSANYSPMVNLIPFGTRTFTSISSRTILGIFELDPVSASGGSGGGGATDTPTATSTSSGGGSTATPTETPTFTPTPGAVYTLTPTSTPIPYATATSTPTTAPLNTSTPTPTSAPACQSPSLSSIGSSNKTISTTISNPNSVAATITSVQLTWNRATGGPGGNVNDLKSASLGSGFWSGINTSGAFSMSTSLTVLGSSSPAMTFTFDKNYQSNTNASVTLVISVTGCGTYTVSTP